jgi:hypothetical protein
VCLTLLFKTRSFTKSKFKMEIISESNLRKKLNKWGFLLIRGGTVCVVKERGRWSRIAWGRCKKRMAQKNFSVQPTSWSNVAPSWHLCETYYGPNKISGPRDWPKLFIRSMRDHRKKMPIILLYVENIYTFLFFFKKLHFLWCTFKE